MSESKAPLEIERKWLVTGWPEHLPLLMEQTMRQGYIDVRPTVRIREENTTFSKLDSKPVRDEFILCFKSSGLLTRKEIEFPIEKEQFQQLEDLIGQPLIPKIRRTYLLSNERHLEVNLVDKGSPACFMYAEIEFPDESQARSYLPGEDSLKEYLNHEVTGKPGESMGAYWERTRMKKR